MSCECSAKLRCVRQNSVRRFQHPIDRVRAQIQPVEAQESINVRFGGERELSRKPGEVLTVVPRVRC